MIWFQCLVVLTSAELTLLISAWLRISKLISRFQMQSLCLEMDYRKAYMGTHWTCQLAWKEAQFLFFSYQVQAGKYPDRDLRVPGGGFCHRSPRQGKVWVFTANSNALKADPRLFLNLSSSRMGLVGATSTQAQKQRREMVIASLLHLLRLKGKLIFFSLDDWRHFLKNERQYNLQ